MIRTAYEPGGTIAKRLGASLKAARESREVSQEDLSAAIGVSQSSVARYERGQMIPRPYVMDLIAAYLLLPVSQVFDRPSLNEMYETYRADEAEAA